MLAINLRTVNPVFQVQDMNLQLLHVQWSKVVFQTFLLAGL